MKKLLVLLCSAAFCCSGMTEAMADAPSTPRWNPDDTAPMTDDVASAAAHARATHCKTPSCNAIIIIHELIDILRFDVGDANGVASLNTGNRPQIAGRRLDRVLLRHPDLYAAVCATGGKLIARFGRAPEFYEMIVPVQLLINSIDMDLRDHGHCAQDLLAVLPKDHADDEVRLNANTLCVNGIENHDRPKAACDVLIQGLDIKR